MVWIRTTQPPDAAGELARSYRRLGIGSGRAENIILAHSEAPHTLDGHMALYKSVLHHRANKLDKALAEAIGVLVSLINGCDYCVTHHRRGLPTRALSDQARCEQWVQALQRRDFGNAFEPAEAAALDYAASLTLEPAGITRDDIESLREAGWHDGEILEINQVAAYFAYANRVVLGLGVSIEGE